MKTILLLQVAWQCAAKGNITRVHAQLEGSRLSSWIDISRTVTWLHANGNTVEANSHWKGELAGGGRGQ